MTAPAPALHHGGCVAAAAPGGALRGVLIRGAPGAGKSAFALRLLALGARLVADDCVRLEPRGGALIASAPEALRGVIEARGVGLLRLPALAEAPVALVVDLVADPAADRAARSPASERTPLRHTVTICGVTLPLISGVGNDVLASIALLLSRDGARLDPEKTPPL